MEHVRGRISYGDCVVLDNLDVTLKVIEPTGRIPQWCGGFLLNDPTVHIEAHGPPYRLELADGRTGNVTVTDVDYSIESRSRRVLFSGAGSLS